MNVKETLDQLLEATAYKAGAEARIAHLRSLLAEEAFRRYDEEEAAPTWKAKGSGSVRLDVPDEKPMIVDDEAWLEFVRRTSPDDVVASYRVRENVLTAVVDRCERAGVQVVDPETGELIPGVEYRQSPPRLVVTLDPSRKSAAVAEALEDVS